ncbi:MAG TPA: NifB/NifX family molybdenum-iron cluster-binding protein [Clostridia bacterium]|nr:NifB/NifX family molybdenum-iron cluster-binding protein [Clostridia bacterium]
MAKKDEMISEHFGHCDGYEIFDAEEKEIEDTGFIPYPGHKPGFLPKFLAGKNVDTIISGGMGASAQELFRKRNINVVIGVTGNVEEAVKNYIDGEIEAENSFY